MTAGGHRRTRLLLFALLVALYAFSGPLAAAACALAGCDDGCDPATCHHRAAPAASTTGDSVGAAGCTCTAHSHATPHAAIPATDNGLSQLAGLWLAAAPPSVTPLSAPRPRLPRAEPRLCKLLSVVGGASGWRAPPSA